MQFRKELRFAACLLAGFFYGIAAGVVGHLTGVIDPAACLGLGILGAAAAAGVVYAMTSRT